MFTCGSHFKAEAQGVVNGSCTVDFGGSSPKYVFLGNGAFITGSHTFTGYDGVTGDDVDLVVFWEQSLDAEGEPDNSTCGSVETMSVNCVDNGSPINDGPYFMETTNDHRGAKEANWNIQIYPAGQTDLALNLVDRFGDAVGVQNMSCDGWTISEDTVIVDDGGLHNDDGSWTISQNLEENVAGGSGGDIVQCSVTQQPGQKEVIDFWQSTVA
jgi:hypothetical protein